MCIRVYIYEIWCKFEREMAKIVYRSRSNIGSCQKNSLEQNLTNQAQPISIWQFEGYLYNFIIYNLLSNNNISVWQFEYVNKYIEVKIHNWIMQ